MKESFTFSKILRLLLSFYLAGSLFYATIHLLGFGWFQSPSSSSSSSSSLTVASGSSPVSVNQLQKKYHSLQTVTWTNAEGNYLFITDVPGFTHLFIITTINRWSKSINSGGFDIEQSIFGRNGPFKSNSILF